MWMLTILSPNESIIASICPVVLAWPMSKHTPRSVPSTICPSCSAERPRKNGIEGMFSIATVTSIPDTYLSRALMDSFAYPTALCSSPPTAMDVSPGWTVTTFAPISTAASMFAMVSSRDASLRRSLIAAMFQSHIGACTWHLRPFSETMSATFEASA